MEAANGKTVLRRDPMSIESITERIATAIEVAIARYRALKRLTIHVAKGREFDAVPVGATTV